jgi:Uma2 family endonuclease
MAMATMTRWETLRDLVEQLGSIPLERIRMNPPPGRATEADVVKAMEREKRYFELVDGVLVEKAVGYEESFLAVAMGAILRAFVNPRNLGVVSGTDGMVRLFPGLIRGPDVAFASWDRFPDRRIPKDPIPTLVPDLVIEILSKSNTAKEMKRKRGEYLSQGVSLVWEIDPRKRTATVYQPDGSKTVLSESDRLDGGNVLPGFSLELRELFAELDRHG